MCKGCGNRGFVYSEMLFSAGAYGSIKQCKECNDLAKYSAEIKKRLDAIDKIEPEKKDARPFGVVIPLFRKAEPDASA